MLPVIVTGKPKISTGRRQVLPDIDLRQMRFRIDCTPQYLSQKRYLVERIIHSLLYFGGNEIICVPKIKLKKPDAS